MDAYNEPMDVENNPLLWLPPDPEDKEEGSGNARKQQEFFPTHSPSDHQGIVVSLSTRCSWKGTVCEQSHLLSVKSHEISDLHLGQFLQDSLFDQNWRCSSCEMPAEAHVSCYTYQQGSITVSVKKLSELMLPGETEGKIWMWYKCLKCPRENGLPPETKSVLTSDAARNLSFGKFLELSFSNHAETNMVSGCGHSINRDCLRFFGSGRMVACFQFASINVHSVILPPQKLEFNYDNQEWIQKEANEVCCRADDLFTEVSKALHEIMEKITVNSGAEAQDSGQQVAELEGTLKKERMEFEELLGKMLNREVKTGQTAILNILEINHLRRQLVLLAYSWEQRLVQISSSCDRDSHTFSLGQRNQEPEKNAVQGHSEGQFSTKGNLPGTLDAAWTGEGQSVLHHAGVRLMLPVGINNNVAPIYEDEPSSIISYALLSPEYHVQMSDESKNVIVEPSDSESRGSTDPTEEMVSSSFLDPLSYTASHICISFSEAGSQGEVKYSVTCYYAKRFEALRNACCFSELDFIRSLSRCMKCDPQGSKKTFHAKTLDDHFIIKEVTKKELESFIMFAPAYFKYLSESIASRSPTCLAKIFGIYQITSKNLKTGKGLKMEVLVMENLMLGHNITRMYELKGCSESRHNPDPSGNNKVLLDQSLIEAMPSSPIYVGSKAKRLLERVVWNDTSFLASVNVMEYSLLVGLDEEKHELVVGVIDYMTQYTWDKQLETWVKKSLGIVLGGTKNASPAVISPIQYKKRFRKAMSVYFTMVPDEKFHI